MRDHHQVPHGDMQFVSLVFKINNLVFQKGTILSFCLLGFIHDRQLVVDRLLSWIQEGSLRDAQCRKDSEVLR